ncbi:MAG TPA: dihydrofolate reductase [Kofleriaceae bacterium]
MFDCVVAADRDWGIGKINGLPWPKLGGDLAHFKRVTSLVPSAVIMGRKTWESSEVAQQPLPKRTNIVVTRHARDVPSGVLVAASLEAALAAVPADKATFVVGGAVLFKDAFVHPALRWIYLTRIAGHFNCDVHIDNLDDGFEPDAWDGDADLEDNGVRYTIRKLRRRPRT